MGSYSSSFEILDEVTDLVFDGYRKGFDLTQLISHRFSLEQAVEAIEIASHPTGGLHEDYDRASCWEQGQSRRDLMATTMKAAILHGREDIRIERVPVPEAATGELIVRVGAALTCGTDLKVFRRGYHARMIVPPALFGHELAGTVVRGRRGRNRLRSRRPRGGAQLRALRALLFLRARTGKSLRRPALQ